MKILTLPMPIGRRASPKEKERASSKENLEVKEKDLENGKVERKDIQEGTYPWKIGEGDSKSSSQRRSAKIVDRLDIGLEIRNAQRTTRRQVPTLLSQGGSLSSQRMVSRFQQDLEICHRDDDGLGDLALDWPEDIEIASSSGGVGTEIAVTDASLRQLKGHDTLCRFPQYKGYTFREIVLRDVDFTIWVMDTSRNHKALETRQF